MKTQYSPPLSIIPSVASSINEPQMAEIHTSDRSVSSTARTGPARYEEPITHEGLSIKARLLRIFCCGAK
jgi:hypothetical protein